MHTRSSTVEALIIKKQYNSNRQGSWNTWPEDDTDWYLMLRMGEWNFLEYISSKSFIWLLNVVRMEKPVKQNWSNILFTFQWSALGWCLVEDNNSTFSILSVHFSKIVPSKKRLGLQEYIISLLFKQKLTSYFSALKIF